MEMQMSHENASLGPVRDAINPTHGHTAGNRTGQRRCLRRSSLLMLIALLVSLLASVVIPTKTASADSPVSVHLSGWGWSLASRYIANVVVNLNGSEIPRAQAPDVVDLYLTGTLQFNLPGRTDTFDLELRGTRVRSLFFLKQVTGGTKPMVAEFEGSWITDNSSTAYYVACEGRLAVPVPDHVANPYIFVLRTRDADVPSREPGGYVGNLDLIVQRATLCFDTVADTLAEKGSGLKRLLGDVLTQTAVIVREVRKLGTPYFT